MGGNIRVESELGSGSKFIFNVKMKIHTVAECDRLPVINYPDMRALIIDDNVDTRDYLSQILHKFGITCEIAKDGFEAVRMLKSGKNFNIFFVDWAMPGMDGIETTKQIKTILPTDTVVIMFSAIAWGEIEKDAKKAGVDRFLSKPIFPSTVQSALEEIAGTVARLEKRGAEVEIPDLSGRKFLLVEDIEINRIVAAAILEPTNVELDYAVNGKDAVEKFNANKDKYDLILMDIHMPEMDGYQATREIRANGDIKSRTIPIIAMTADAFKEDIDKCKEAGMNGHVAKPINESELYKKISI